MSDLPEQSKRNLEAALGYLGLGMVEDAAIEIENLPPECRAHTEVLKVRIEIYSTAEAWALLEVVAKELERREPADPEWGLERARAVRRTDGISEARKILENLVERHPEEGVIYYNLACYAALESEMQVAAAYLKTAFELQPELKIAALDDPDLDQLWRSFGKP